LLDEARLRHPGDLDSQYDYAAQATGVSQKAKQTVMGRINSAQAEEESRQRKIREDYRQAARNSYGQLMQEGRYAEAAELAEQWDNRYIDEVEKLNYINATRTARELKSDPYVKRALAREVKLGILQKEHLWTDPRTQALTAGDIAWLESLFDDESDYGFSHKNVLADLEYAFKDLYSDDPDIGPLLLIFQEELEFDMAAKEAELKRRLSPQEVREVGMNLLTLHKERSWWGDIFDPNIQYREIDKRVESYMQRREAQREGQKTPQPADSRQPGQSYEDYVTQGSQAVDIPEEMRQRIVEILTRAGKEITPSSVMQFYEQNKDRL
jgi:hypothetical protein